jgi:hypothetical protein
MDSYQLRPGRTAIRVTSCIMKWLVIALLILLLAFTTIPSSPDLVQREETTFKQHETIHRLDAGPSLSPLTKAMKVLLHHLPARCSEEVIHNNIHSLALRKEDKVQHRNNEHQASHDPLDHTNSDLCTTVECNCNPTEKCIRESLRNNIAYNSHRGITGKFASNSALGNPSENHPQSEVNSYKERDRERLDGPSRLCECDPHHRNCRICGSRPPMQNIRTIQEEKVAFSQIADPSPKLADYDSHERDVQDVTHINLHNWREGSVLKRLYHNLKSRSCSCKMFSIGCSCGMLSRENVQINHKRETSAESAPGGRGMFEDTTEENIQHEPWSGRHDTSISHYAHLDPPDADSVALSRRHATSQTCSAKWWLRHPSCHPRDPSKTSKADGDVAKHNYVPYGTNVLHTSEHIAESSAQPKREVGRVDLNVPQHTTLNLLATDLSARDQPCNRLWQVNTGCLPKHSITPVSRAVAVYDRPLLRRNNTLVESITEAGCHDKVGKEKEDCEVKRKTGFWVVCAALIVVGICGLFFGLLVLFTHIRRKRPSPLLISTGHKRALSTPTTSVSELPCSKIGKPPACVLRRIDEDESNETNSVRHYTTLDGAADGWTRWIHKQKRGGKVSRIDRWILPLSCLEQILTGKLTS